MRRKILQDIANTLCQMFVGWRLAEDVSKLVEFTDGTLEIDLLQQTAFHNKNQCLELSITQELSAWFRYRLEVEHISLAEIQKACLLVTYTVTQLNHKRKRVITFNFSCCSWINTNEAEYSGELIETHHWHHHLKDGKP